MMPDKKVISIRNITGQTHAKLSMGARLRGWTEAQYLERLLALHEALRRDADANSNEGEAYADILLHELGLQTVREGG
jgi:hypothetical protein